MVKVTCKLFEIFCGDFVQIHLNKNLKQTVQVGDQLKTIETTIVLEGFLTDEDDKYYYLGLEPEHYHIAVDKKQVVTIEISNPDAEREEKEKEMLANDPGMN